MQRFVLDFSFRFTLFFSIDDLLLLLHCHIGYILFSRCFIFIGHLFWLILKLSARCYFLMK